MDIVNAQHQWNRLEKTAQRVLYQHREAVNDNDAVERAELVMEKHSDAVLKPLFSRVL